EQGHIRPLNARTVEGRAAPMATQAETGTRRFIEAIEEPALLVAGGRIGASNRAARRLFGEDVDGQEVALAIPHPAAVEQLVSGNAAGAGAVELVGLGNSRRRWLMRVAAVDPEYLFVRFVDRSEAHAAEQMRVDFVANASHELRTPLATLVGYTETLRDESDAIEPATRGRFLEIVHDEAKRMQRLVEDLISLSRIEAERFSRPRGALSLREIAGEACDASRGEAARRGNELVVEVVDPLPDVAGDRSELLQLLDNLISNALRYGREGAPVRIKLSPEREMVRLEVVDQGEGIPPEHLPRVTERFYRVDPGRSRSLGGTGLGLAIVKHIVGRHRGRLAIDSAPGRGTTVSILLPVAAPAAASNATRALLEASS
ncbi:MAG: ATP-binding protein, partial [Sphingosinicella sp.]